MREREPREPEPAPRAPRAAPSQAAVLALQRSAGNAAVAQMLQRYVEIGPDAQSPTEWPAGGPVRVSDDGTMAVRQEGSRGSNDMWATPSRIAAADASLAKAGSRIRLKEGSGSLAGTAPEYDDLGIPQRVYLSSVEPENVGNATSGKTMDLYADCGRAAREVMGIGGGGLAPSGKVMAKWVEGGKVVETSGNDPEEMANEIIKAAFGGLFSDGWDTYWALPPAERDKFDADHGINAYVRPEVGEAFAMDSELAYPGKFTWNFHWAGVVMSNGEEHVTLENYGVDWPWTENQDWNFQIYGAPNTAAPTFHEEHRADQEHGRDPTTVRSAPRP
jgi:hypothetical protein